jgi:type VI secretion system secreted protein VgrG
LNVDVAPALWLATQSLDSRVYQDLTVPELVEKVSNELLGGRSRTVKRDLTQTYEKHEYLVQHRESHFDFISRLMREEGIFFYFDHDEDESEHEVLILADSNTNRPLVRPNHDGVVEYEEQENQREGREVAFHVHREQHIGPTDAVVRGYDWTNPGLNVHHERTERADWNGPRLEVYDHHHAVRHHGYDDGGGSYRSHTADRHSRLRTERLDLARNRWTVGTTVVTAQPGHVFELQGADTHDGRYLIVAMASSGGSEGHGGGEYTSSLEVIPADMPYRPPQPQRPSMPGPETATVVGPAGEEIYTDKHGRIKVQFHWDRQGQNDEHSSTWIRVAQGWAGTGWGFLFIPRIGMEVIVSFLGGDPDRPVVTGCLYNGTHPTPYALPDEKTKSTIKTNSSLGGGGSNELRFEDKKGSEEVYIHAEKDFNEVVENNHSTRVKHCQANTVDVNQTETIGGEQKMTVKKDRFKAIEQSEWTEITLNRTETVHGAEDVTIDATRGHWVKMDDSLRVDGNESVTVAGRYQVVEAGTEKLVLDNQGWWESAHRIKLHVADTAAQVNMHNNGKLEIAAASEIRIHVGSSSIKLSASCIEIASPTVKINGGNLVQIDSGGEVKIKC